MIQHITCEQAHHLIRQMDDSAPIPAGDFVWYALYAGQRYPLNIAYGNFSTDQFGLMGIYARVPFGHVVEEPIVKPVTIIGKRPQPVTIEQGERVGA